MTASALIIAGFASSGAGGIPVDIKTLSALGVYPAAAVTALVSSGEATHIELLEPTQILTQARSATTALGSHLRAVKVGFLGSAEATVAVGDFLHQLKTTSPQVQVLVDPVLYFKSGAVVKDRTAAAQQINQFLLPHADFVTPNLAEAAALAGATSIADSLMLQEIARIIASQHPQLHVLVKGGMRLAGEHAFDCYAYQNQAELWSGTKLGEQHINGTGCTLAAAITGYLALGFTPREAALRGRELVRAELLQPLILGTGARALSGVNLAQGRQVGSDAGAPKRS